MTEAHRLMEADIQCLRGRSIAVKTMKARVLMQAKELVEELKGICGVPKRKFRDAVYNAHDRLFTHFARDRAIEVALTDAAKATRDICSMNHDDGLFSALSVSAPRYDAIPGIVLERVDLEARTTGPSDGATVAVSAAAEGSANAVAEKRTRA